LPVMLTSTANVTVSKFDLMCFPDLFILKGGHCVTSNSNSALQCLNLIAGDSGKYHLRIVNNPLISGLGNLGLLEIPIPSFPDLIHSLLGVLHKSVVCPFRPHFPYISPCQVSSSAAIKGTCGSLSPDRSCIVLLTRATWNFCYIALGILFELKHLALCGLTYDICNIRGWGHKLRKVIFP
jgi:hypothetical protein